MTPTRKQRDDFDIRTGPTLLEMMVGLPREVQGLTEEARNLKAFAETAKGTIRQIGERHFSVMGDPSLTDGARLIRSANHAKTLIQRARSDFGERMRRAEVLHEQLKAKIDAAMKPPAGAGDAAVDSDLRAWARGMPSAELIENVRGDLRVMAAIVRAPSVLSGVSDELHQKFQHEYAHAVLPNEAAQYDDLRQAITTALTAVKAIETEAGALIDFDTAASLEGRQTSATV